MFFKIENFFLFIFPVFHKNSRHFPTSCKMIQNGFSPFSCLVSYFPLYKKRLYLYISFTKHPAGPEKRRLLSPDFKKDLHFMADCGTIFDDMEWL